MHTKAFVSFVKALYQEKMQLILPLPMKGGKTCKKMKKRAWESYLDEEIGET